MKGSLKGSDDASVKGRHIKIDSDSDSEGFLEEKSRTSSKGSSVKGGGKIPSDSLKSGKKVSLDSLKSGGKASFNTPIGSGGKDYKTGKAGGKGSLPHAQAVKVPIVEVDLKLELDLPKDAKVLMDCEATEILEGIQDHLLVLSRDPDIKMPESFNKALQHSKYGSHYTDVQSVRQVLDTLKVNGVTDGEICMIGNILPESVDEIYALVPSLKDNRDNNEGPIKDVLSNLAKYRNPK
ncbi:DNA-directed RNA polymerase II subunit RPB4 protein [Dioscorea alata]|uniref:DNA-directed RNA polymerase II subunit RPB4 protein n=3 Tax=Dioscorea alata TaxID=55571 RepID=A0ACB7VJL9_DIOAL|nr:DNA-directed RNA polymerase II subunit RPB4 protein [Dioscorea alata]KAH7674318.1 DNA-directed RNA polymerase II subunit RPB4 protein [Dioscorea alata]